jgi:5-methylcytosine-specific restriction protein A
MTDECKTTCADHPGVIANFVLTPELTHWGKYVCSKCGRFLAWVKKPDNEKRNRRVSKKLARPFENAGIDYCQLCLRQRCELPPNMTFVAHHIVEVQDGGSDDPANLLHLCTFCHEMVHLLRRNRMDAKNRPDTVKVWQR